MKSMITFLIAGILLGIILSLLIVFFASPAIMLKESKSKYDFERTTAEFEKSVTDAGWKLPHVNDLQATLKKFGKDVQQVKVYEICQPDHAYKILNQDDERIVSTLMPCRVAIYEKSDGKVYLSRMNSGLIAKPMKKIIRKTMAVAAEETESILEPVIE